ncbi:MAG TPA: hypothetical protein VF860_16925 [Candidatus Acidoferrales bacterium]
MANPGVPQEKQAPANKAKTTNTAILVIHGIGEQNPYDTLDSFARGFAHYFQTEAGQPLLTLRPERISHKDWTEVAIHLESDRPLTPRGLRRLSLFEFYWAPFTEGKVTYRGVLSWLARTTLTPLRYLTDNLQALLAAQRKLPKEEPRSATFLFLRELWRTVTLYIPLLLVIAFLAWFIPGSAKSLSQIWEKLPPLLRQVQSPYALAGILICLVVAAVLLVFIVKELWSWANRLEPGIEHVAERSWVGLATFFIAIFLVLAWLIKWCWQVDVGALAKVLLGWRTLGLLAAAGIAWLLREVLVKYVGDVTVYVTADEKSASYEARATILKNSTESLARLLYAGAAGYDQVILAGHSLGSVIAYDSVNELLSQVWAAPDQTGQGPAPKLGRADLAKLKGLVTFGSPLDKIYYFFREHVGSDQAVRAQILSFLHSFRRERSGREYKPFTFTYGDPKKSGQAPSSFPQLDEDFRWLNVWSRMDPVSGELRFYELREKDRLHLWYWRWGLAHLAYWGDRRFYRFLAGELL